MEVKEVKEICKQVDTVWDKLHTVLDCSHDWKSVYKHCRRHAIKGREFSGYSKFDFPLQYEIKMAIIRQFSHFQNGDIPAVEDFNSIAMYIYSAYSLFFKYSLRLEAQNIKVPTELTEVISIGSH